MTGEKTYEAGTLRYSAAGLRVLFLWLLWGDFAFSFFESIFGRFIPLYLKDLQASNALIGVMTGSFAGLVNFFFLPNISRWSDDFRSRFGRRIPFLVVVTPLTVASLVLVGFAPEIGAWLHSGIAVRFFPDMSQNAVILAFLCVCFVAFHFFNMVLCGAYNWLQRDVVPQDVMVRFLSLFRIVGTVSALLFLWFVFPYIISHRREVCVSISVFYLITFLLMCSKVKEGAYPPPPAKESRPGVLKAFTIYFRECLSLPIYRNFFLTYIFVLAAANASSPFLTLYSRENLGLDMDDIGKIAAWGLGLHAVLYYPMGRLCDRFTPIGISLVGLVGMLIGSVLAFFLIHDKTSFFIYTMVFSVPTVAWGLGSLSVTMKLFPSEKFGQFSSAMNVFGFGALIPLNYLIGKIMDMAHSNYRMTFVWSVLFFALAIVSMVAVYRDWKKYGGPHHYVPPLPAA